MLVLDLITSHKMQLYAIWTLWFYVEESTDVAEATALTQNKRRMSALKATDKDA